MIAISMKDATWMAAPPLIDPFVASMDGSYCRVTKAKNSDTPKVRAKI